MGYADLSDGFNSTNCSIQNPQNCLNTGPGFGNKVFYQIDTNPLIARISTINKSIGTTALNQFTADNLNTTEDTANMLPYLAIYETEPVESLLDIYWETTSEGLIVDLNADVLTGAGGATSFKDVTWVFDETTAAGTFVTTQYFEPLDVEGNPFGAPVARFDLVGQTDGNGNPVELFERVLGTGNNAGKAQLKFLGDANGQPLVFTAASRELNVYTFVFEIETADGDISELTLEGQVGGPFGALKNIAPSFSAISPDAITNIDSLVLPASAWSSAVNGTASTTTDANKQGLRYLMEAVPGEIDVIDDYGWEIDQTNGQITQPVPPAPGTPIPNGIYKVKVTLQDAWNVGGAEGDYSFLSQSQEITITIGYPAVNPEALSNVCTLGIASITPPKTEGPYSYTTTNIETLQAITCPPSPFEVGSGSTTGPPSSGFWYVGDQNVTISDSNPLIDSIYDISNGIFNGIFTHEEPAVGGGTSVFNKLYKIGGSSGKAHSQGTLMFTINIETSAGSVPTSSSQYFLKGLKFYYRKKDSNGLYEAWAPIEWNQEYNSALSFDPNLGQWPTLFTVVPVSRQVNTKLWLQYVKAFDKSDFDTNQNSNDVEYLIVLDDLSETNGQLEKTKPLAWATATDTHYPTCVVWRGKNAATTSSAGTYSYKYSASAPSDQATAVLSPLNVTLYGDNPLGDYVNNFYTDASLSTVYSPPSSTPFINYTLDVSNFSSTLDVWKLGGHDFNLQWTVQLDSNGGERIDGAQFLRTKAAIVGLYPGTTGEAFPTGPGGDGFFKGTTRIYQNL